MFGRSISKYKGPLGNVVNRTVTKKLDIKFLRFVTVTSGPPTSSLSSVWRNYPLIQDGLPKICGPISCSDVNVRYYSDDKYPEHFKVKLPALSPTMELGTIVSWEKKEGDALSEGDLLCEIETDKATMGFETPEEGYLAKIVLPAGTKDVPIGKLLCVITSNAEDVAQFKDYVAPKEESDDKSTESSSRVAPDEPFAPKVVPIKAPVLASVQQPAPAPPPSRILSSPNSGTTKGSPKFQRDARPFASPAAKKAATERGVDLMQMTGGSGMDGMITVKDVESFISTAPAASAQLTGGMAAVMGQGHTDEEISNMRRVIAKRLQSSKLEVPHYYLTVDCEMDEVMKLRQDINANNDKEGIKLSVNDFIIKATALACRKVPAVNSAWMDTFIREYHTCDVSVAVDTGRGLITPIVTSAERKGLAEISQTIREMAARAKEGKLQPHEFQGGTITVSNLGMFGISHFTAIINSPQSCVLAVGATKPKVIPVGKDGSTRTANVMSVTLSCDHRVVDGAVGAQWLQKFKNFVEQPTSMLL